MDVFKGERIASSPVPRNDMGAVDWIPAYAGMGTDCFASFAMTTKSSPFFDKMTTSCHRLFLGLYYG
jgi:hypothetical protein